MKIKPVNEHESRTQGGERHSACLRRLGASPPRGGALRVWEPHGFIRECMRSANDQRQPWLDLLNPNGTARRLWCEQRGYAAVQSNASLKEFVEETSALLDEPCK